MSAPVPSEATSVLDFWFGAPGSAEHGSSRRAWWIKDEAFDRSVREHFGATIEQALRGELDAWADEAHSALARIVVLDQFTRNAFRGTARAFAGDARALAAAAQAVGTRQDEALAPFMRAFVYMPFEHAEGISAQDEAVRLFTRLVAGSSEQVDMLDYAHRHRAVPASQRHPRPTVDGRGDRLSEGTRLDVLRRASPRAISGDSGRSDGNRNGSARRRGRGRRPGRGSSRHD